MKHITSLEPSKLEEIVKLHNQPPYRVKQIFQWIYKKRVYSFDDMSNLPQYLREGLKGEISFSFPRVVDCLTSEDGTQKFLIQLSDGGLIESVAIKEEGRLTLCVSSQIGCRQLCAFCLTGKLGYKRSLLHHEISDQIIVTSPHLASSMITNVVIMGMGEPLDNYREVIKAVKTMTDKDRLNISPKGITLSTAGIVPGINALGKEGLGIKLAVSLNAPNDKIRNALMPVNRRFPLSKLFASLKEYPLQPRERITLEYCMIRGINDTSKCALYLIKNLRGLKGRIKINLIPFNRSPLLPFLPTTPEALERFHKCLTEHGILATVRKSKGGDILAACGQLGYLAKEF